MEKSLTFNIHTRLKGTLARTGEIITPHGIIKTPAYIAGGTNATVKALTPEQILSTGAQGVLANTYHLMLRPTADIIQKAGGIHKFMNWQAPTFTDSGGFQVFSLGMAYKKGIDATSHTEKGSSKLAQHSKDQLAKVGEDGVWFKSHISGEKIFMSPEISMELQHKISADIHMAFDELTSPLAGREQIISALNKTHKWAERCLECHNKLNHQHLVKNEPLQSLFAVVQGAREEDLRRKSASFLGSKDFDGYGIGGVFQPEEIPEVLTWVNTTLPENKPRHLLGMGAQPADLFLGVEYGIDTFDCVAPTRQARNAALFTYHGRINIKNAQYKEDFTPIDKDCHCYTCQNFTKAYINHLFRADEILASTLASIHNEYFVINTVDRIRESLENGTFFEYKKEFLENYYGKEKAQKYLK